MVLLFSGQVFAHKIEIDPLGNIYHFWLAPTSSSEGLVPSTEGTALKFSKSNFAEPQTLYTFSQEATSYDIEIDHTKYYLAYATQDSDLYLIHSRDNGQTFSPPLLFSEQGKNPALAVKNDLLTIAWEEEKGIYYCKLEDGNTDLLETEAFFITGEALSAPALWIDDLNKTGLAFLSKNSYTDLKRVMYTSWASPEPRVLYESHDNLKNLGIRNLSESLLVFWQKEYMGRRETYFCVSLDGGQTFSSEKRLELEKDLLGLIFSDGKFSSVTADPELIIREIELPALSAPQVLFPHQDAVLSSSDLKLVYAYPGNDPFLCRIELLADARDLEQLISSPTQENLSYDFPVEFTDGSYSLKIHIFDGINRSPDSQIVSFKIDNIPPQIQSLEVQKEEKQLTLKGNISEFPAWLTINGQSVSVEASRAYFESEFALVPGENIFTLTLTDEAGNISVSTEEAFYDPAVPEITVLKPKESDWFKPDSAIVVEARVCDLQGDIEDETEAEITINNQVLEDTLVYDQLESNLFGFISLPAELNEGKYPGTITLRDKSGNTGQASFTINIDGSPPRINQPAGESCFTNSQTSLAVPAMDGGAGIDPSGTLIKIAGVSLEGSVSVEAQKIIFETEMPLSEGTYEVEIIARDRIGNVAEPIAFCLVVDTTPPELTLLGSYESNTAQGKIVVQGETKDQHPCSLNIYNNQKKIESFALSGDSFSKEIRLFQGSNNILIEVLDRSNNSASASINTFANFAAASSSLIQNCVHGPNPFSPSQNLPGAFAEQGKGMVFTYSLSAPAHIKIRIYDLTGTLIWTRDIANATSGVTAWSGESAFGQIVNNGIYPYIFSASSGGVTEIKRGKIMVYQ